MTAFYYFSYHITRAVLNNATESGVVKDSRLNTSSLPGVVFRGRSCCARREVEVRERTTRIVVILGERG